MPELDPTRDSYEAQIVAAREEMHVAMVTTGDRLQAMFNAGVITGTPPERDLAREVRETFAVAYRAFMLFNELDPNAASTTYNAEIAEQYAHLLPPEEPKVPRVEEVRVKDLILEDVGATATQEAVRVDDPGDVKDEDLTPEEKRQRYLNMELPALFKKLEMEGPHNKGLRTKTIRLLKEEYAATTLRDVLLLGSHRITDIEGLATKSIELLRRALESADIGLTLKFKPTPEDAVEICGSLNNLPAKFYFKEFYAQLGGRSVAELQAMTTTELAGLLAYKGVSNPVAAQNILDYLKHVSLDFSRAAADKALKEL